MAVTSPNMGLKVWNLLTDPYDHAQLADNWAKVDQHDHSFGKGTQIPTGGIADGAITAAKIAGGTIPTLSLTNASVTTAKLANSAVTTAKIGTGQVTSGSIADGTIQTADIAAAQITNALIANDAVDATKLKDDPTTDANRSVTTDHIRDGAVTSNKLGSALAGYAGVNTSTSTYRGFVNTAGTFSTTSKTYVTIDSLAGIVVPANARLMIGYAALWQLASASNAGSITIFIGANELATLSANSATGTVISTSLSQTGTFYGTATTGSSGFTVTASTSSDSGIPTTGIMVPGISTYVAAGTYTISVQGHINATSGGTLNVKNRFLWARSEGY